MDNIFQQEAYKVVKGLAAYVEILQHVPLKMLPDYMQQAVKDAVFLTMQHITLNGNMNPMDNSRGVTNNVFNTSTGITG